MTASDPSFFFIFVETPSQIAIVAEMAKAIWVDHFVPLIGRAQVDYMLERFQSEAAISKQIGDGVRYVIAVKDGAPAGYAAWVCAPRPDEVQLSKLYVMREVRRQGIGRRLLAHVVAAAEEAAARAVWLTVNKHNDAAIRAYERLGFVREGEMVTDIGHGFVMDDFKMIKALPKPRSGHTPRL